MVRKETLITLYSDVQTTPVNWLWYPYIAIGKITILQGDPGDGKSTMMLHLIAELSRGGHTPDGASIGLPQRVIYQCSEDGAGDTIKPRLESCGANCHNIAFINEEVYSGLTLKVAAYIRVSTDNDEQQSSFNLQRKEFTDRINANPLWENAGIYSDEGISGTELSHRKGMLQMINDAKEGKIQLILAKSIARFARNVVDCLSIIEELKQLNPPVGVYFDESNLYTLDRQYRCVGINNPCNGSRGRIKV